MRRLVCDSLWRQDSAPGAADGVRDQARLVTSLGNPAVYGNGVEHVTVLETHISYVLLTGRYAYKIKKAVDLEFLDFTTLSARRFYCEEELRLNRRLAPSLYLDVVAITGSPEAPVIGGSGPVLEYAVKMRQFPQDALLSHVLARNALTGTHIDALAATVASFHGRVAVARSDAAFPTAENILLPAIQNFAQIWPWLNAGDRADVEALRAWTQREYAARALSFARRRREGFVRECHGDLHLGNIALIDGAITVFDGIEFNQSMRWIDVMSDVAFLVMDLQDRKRPDLASRFLNGYLEITGDYEGLDVLRFYLAYRAMVRAKVTRLRASQLASADARELQAEYRGYLDLAHQYVRPPQPAIVITHGPSGCGKTTLSQTLSELIDAIRIRTDVERKRAHGLSAQTESGSALGGGLYAPEATRQLYLRVSSLARGVARAGHIALVDGTFLKRWQRDLFRNLAAGLGIPFVIIAFSADVETLRERIARRIQREHDASEATFAVLDQQLLSENAIAPEERPFTVEYNAEGPLERAGEAASWRTVIDKLGLTELARPNVPDDQIQRPPW